MKKVLLIATCAFLFACTKDDKNPTEFKSAEVAAFNGKAWTSLQVTPKGEPKELTLVLNEALLNSAPIGDHGSHDPHENTFIIPVPAKAAEVTPYKFVMLNWNPNGHEPDHIYTIPHFDMHFFMTAPAEVMEYVDMAKLQTDPAADYLPANHLGGAPVPMMGKHWIDVTSPELNGAPFTETFIYGSYNGNVVFYEPMITLDFLKQQHHYVRAIPQPAKFKTTGYYPTKMKVQKKNGTTEISLTDFVYKQGS